MPELSVALPTNLVVCLETIQEIASLSLIPPGLIQSALDKMGI